jgi:hypothetical protein
MSRSQLLLGSYRKDDFAAPEAYRVSLGAVFKTFADYVIEQATDPRNGIQSVSKFPPSIAEIVDFCNEIMRRASYASEWDARAARQLEERRLEQEQDEREPLDKRREVVARALDHLRQAGFRL